jgi:uncharacterized protein YutE (UPF0331/DUF86 family)
LSKENTLTNPVIVSKRLAKLREYIELLKRLRSEPKERFLDDPFVYGNAERYTQLAIQVALDIGSHVIADDKLGNVSEYRDIVRILGEARYLPSPLVQRLLPLAGLRNILVHDYLEVDRGRLYEVLQRGLEDLEEFALHIGKLL